MALRQLLRPLLPSPPRRNPHLAPPQPPPHSSGAATTRRALVLLGVLAAAAPALPRLARAQPDGEDVDEARVVRLFEEASPSVVFIKDLVVAGPQGRGGAGEGDDEEGGAIVEGTGSGFVWDSAGHIVTNYHVVAKLAGDGAASHRCKVFFEDSSGNSYSKEGRLVGCDPAYDLAVLKVDADGEKLRPALIGTSRGLRVGQSCFAIGNPYGYEHTLTTGWLVDWGGRYHRPMGEQFEGLSKQMLL